MPRKKKIADMDEINALWSELLRNEEESPQVRLKASELRAKAAGSQEGEGKTPAIPLSQRKALLREIAEKFGADAEADRK